MAKRSMLMTTAGLAAVLAGCGGGGGAGRHAGTPPEPHATGTTAAPPKPESPEAVYMFRVLGDDPLPDTVTVRRDGSAVVVRGGGHGGSRFDDVVLSRREQRKVLRLARIAPLRILAHNTITPGGFGGWDNTMRYLIRRDHKSVGVEQGHIPPKIRPLVRELNRIIENDVGRIASSRVQSGTALAGVDK